MSYLRAAAAGLSLVIAASGALRVCAQTSNGVPASREAALPALELFNYDRALPFLAELVSKPSPGSPAVGSAKPDSRVQKSGSQQPVYETQADFRAYKLSYLSANGNRVPAFFVLPSKPTNVRVPCIVLQHGLGQDKRSFAMLWGTLAKSGYAIFVIDAQYHGERAPALPKETPVELFGQSIFSTRELIIQTVIDLRRGIDYLQTRKEIDPDRIGYVGFSMGGILGTILAGVDERVKAPVLALAGGNWKRMAELSTQAQVIRARQALGANGIGWQPLDPFDPIRYAGRIAPRPVLFVHGDNDAVVPVPCARELHEAAGMPKEVLFYKGGHAPSGLEGIKVLDRIQKWLDAHLKKS